MGLGTERGRPTGGRRHTEGGEDRWPPEIAPSCAAWSMGSSAYNNTVAGPEAVLAYLARYTHRVAISNSRLLALDARGAAGRRGSP